MKSGLDHKILSEEEERELAIRIEAGDMEAREEFILHNLRSSPSCLATEKIVEILVH